MKENIYNESAPCVRQDNILREIVWNETAVRCVCGGIETIDPK